MVSLADFQKVQAIIHGKPSSISKKRRYDFPYRGIIKCGECGCTITPDHKLQVICTNCKCKFSIKNMESCPRCKEKLSRMTNPSFIDILYYHCNKAKGRCSQGSITKTQIDEKIEGKLKEISISKKLYDWALVALDYKEKDKERDDRVIRDLRKRKTDLENRVEGLINLRADNEINSEQFNQSVSKVNDEIFLIEAEIENTEIQKLEFYNIKKQNYDFALNVQERFKNGDNSQKTALVKELVSNLTLFEKKLDITIKKSLLDSKNQLATYGSKNGVLNLN
jgi:hypothetical protein